MAEPVLCIERGRLPGFCWSHHYQLLPDASGYECTKCGWSYKDPTAKQHRSKLERAWNGMTLDSLDSLEIQRYE